MLKCLENRGLTFKATLPSEELQRKMPLWHHPEEGEVRLQGNNGPKAKCLRQIHSVLTVGEGVETAGRLQDNTHESSATCLCDACEEDKAKGCKNPHACAEGAKTKLDLLHPEWDP
ncbi:hypothetical protein DFH08DRAFT_620191, partial [Mycena albidolilacea]